ncbi:DUF3667 domain-containing protein [Pseudoxanthomonas sp.]|uniref:DUF3667 domain-containing protein n=1 Tax=Pseudoxanthomonas sp. TaxID=1871049 RepID=UPI0028C4B7DF|nr:DUF3667 domain-containing protein [Pseudoxanthomonas sp.]
MASSAPSTRHAGLRQRLRQTTRDMLHGLVPPASAVRLAQTDAPVDDAHFAAPVCRNCGAPRATPHCGACGQKAAARFSLRDVWQEVWQSRRLFELPFLHAALRLARAPGQVAREYVLGARKRHVHPLKLLLVAVAALVVLLDRTGYLTAGQTELSGQMQVVASWARWSFSLGLLAVLAATWTVLRRRGGYNPVEHLVLAVYVQFVVIAANALNLLPLLVLDAARWAVPWRQAASWYMTPLELLVVAVACRQFFHLRWRRDGWRIAAVLALFFLGKKVLLLAYGRLVYHVALAH